MASGGQRFCEDSTEVAFWYGWETLKEYLNCMEEYLKNSQKQFEDQNASVINAFTSEQDREFAINLIESQIFQYDELPYVIRNSFFVSSYSLLEVDINKICRKLKDSRNIQKNLCDLRGGLLEQTKTFFKLANLDIASYDSWTEINNYSKVRNCIVHMNGLLSRDKKDPFDYCQTNRLIKNRLIVPDNPDEKEIGLTGEYCIKTVVTMQQFIDTAYKDSAGRLHNQ
jgi:hypothetical protein